jgi:hypothetical protein
MRTHTAAFHLGPFPKGVYLVVRSPTSDQPLRFSPGFATPTTHAHGAVLCRGSAPSSGRTLEIRATPPDSDSGETACTYLAKLARKDGIAFHTVTKREVIGVTNVSPLVLYFEFQGPLGSVIGAAHLVRAEMAKMGVPTPAGVGPTTTVVTRPQGREACAFHADKLTTRIYGSKTLTQPLCKALRKTLADRSRATSRT